MLIQSNNDHGENRLPKRGATDGQASCQRRLLLKIISDHHHRRDKNERRPKPGHTAQQKAEQPEVLHIRAGNHAKRRDQTAEDGRAAAAVPIGHGTRDGTCQIAQRRQQGAHEAALALRPAQVGLHRLEEDAEAAAEQGGQHVGAEGGEQHRVLVVEAAAAHARLLRRCALALRACPPAIQQPIVRLDAHNFVLFFQLHLSE